ncbi:hypothetical protein SAMN03097694_1533 [Janthinobacterium lividum]|uniref:Uncharacterized protein n=1 Tax=Janthinobacterium lividum TaxID=29581 RepID=A0AB38C549_9BURK|nr:hypothetical protein [Janthinobacterium lividum]SFX30061.1 hypothetical protein SAMN03097694_1533 [Janthinobacterium lividum]
MKILVALICRNKAICDAYIKHGSEIINKNCFPRSLREQVHLEPKFFNPGKEFESVESFLFREMEDWDGIVLLVEKDCMSDVQNVRSAFFIGQVEFAYLPNIQNVLSSYMSRLLKNFAFLLSKTMDAVGIQAAMLPLRNFKAEDMSRLNEICREMTLDNEFREDFAEQFAILMRRRGPKRRSKYPDLYFVDDDDRHFDFGDEQHALADSGPPHLVSCQIANRVRFGRQIDSRRHFNVTQGDKDKSQISGTFLDCHGQSIHVRATTHINMFSNDFS